MENIGIQYSSWKGYLCSISGYVATLITVTPERCEGVNTLLLVSLVFGLYGQDKRYSLLSKVSQFSQLVWSENFSVISAAAWILMTLKNLRGLTFRSITSIEFFQNWTKLDFLYLCKNLNEPKEMHGWFCQIRTIDSGGSKGLEGRPPWGPNSFNFIQFLGKFGKIVCWRPPWGVGAPSSGKSWIRHWLIYLDEKPRIMKKVVQHTNTQIYGELVESLRNSIWIMLKSDRTSEAECMVLELSV